ncbi:MAG: transposase [Planctomycetes bacterium]|nr:transposase [Planctomycetota bacterium]
MKTPLGFRKKICHFNVPGQWHELTFSCVRKIPLLANDGRCALLARSIDRATLRHRFGLVAFVFMPDHVHLMVSSTRDSGRVEDLLYAIKRPFSYRVKIELQERDDPLLDSLMIRERPGKRCFRFWQEGPGYDRNVATRGYVAGVLSYLHLNPVRRGLCSHPSDWRWSSWKYYNHPESSVDPDLPRIDGCPA